VSVAIAINVPEVCGTASPVVVQMVTGKMMWTGGDWHLRLQVDRDDASFGSGAPGGVFTPSLFMGAGAGLLFGTAVHHSAGVARSIRGRFALVGMGAFIVAASHAPDIGMR